MRNLIFYLGLISLGVFSCTSKTVETTDTFKKLSLVHLRDIMLPLDNETSALNNVYRIIGKGDSTKLALFNPLNYCLYTYSLTKREIVSKIQFEKEGPNGLGSRVTAFEMLGDTSILFHSYYRTELIFANFSGVVISRLNLKHDDLDVYPTTNHRAGIGLLGNSAYLYSGNAKIKGKEIERPLLILGYNLSDSSIFDTKMVLSPNYETKEDEYLPRDLLDPAVSSNHEENVVLVGFPLDDSVRVLNDNLEVTTKYFGSSKHVPRIPIRIRDASPGQQGMLKDYMKFSKYGSIEYDSYREIYVRTFREAAKESDLAENKFRAKQRVILADKSFKLLGEADYSGSEQLLFTKEGMLQVMLGVNREDSLRIKVFEYGL